MFEQREKGRLEVTSPDVDKTLLRAIDRAIDDVESGREYPIEEGQRRVQEIRERRRRVTA